MSFCLYFWLSLYQPLWYFYLLNRLPIYLPIFKPVCLYFCILIFLCLWSSCTPIFIPLCLIFPSISLCVSPCIYPTHMNNSTVCCVFGRSVPSIKRSERGCFPGDDTGSCVAVRRPVVCLHLGLHVVQHPSIRLLLALLTAVVKREIESDGRKGRW